MNLSIERQIAGLTVFTDADLMGAKRIFASSLEGFCFSMTPDEADARDDLAMLRGYAEAAVRLPADVPANLAKTSGPRVRHRTDSPVKSSRFL